MPAHNKIRGALGRGFYVENLRAIVTLSLKTLQDSKPKHPAVFFMLATISQWIVDAWDEKPISVATVDRVEGQIRPHLEHLLNVAESDAGNVCTALDAVAEAFRVAIRSGLDT